MKIIDISHVLNEDTPIYPGDCKLNLSKYKSIDEDYYCSYLLKTCLHTGTHIDMPMHLIEDYRMASDFTLNHFIGNGILLDVRGENIITMKTHYEDMITNESIVLLFTGFDKYYNTDKYFFDHPVVSDELMHYFISKKIKILGMDMPSPDFPPHTIHKELLRKDIFVLENLTKLQDLVGVDKFEVMALPLKISAEASFVRAACRIVK